MAAIRSRPSKDARLRDDISAGDAREEYVNLIHYRLEVVLGYRWTHPFEVLNEGWATHLSHDLRNGPRGGYQDHDRHL
jgi:hypothetical protein